MSKTKTYQLYINGQWEDSVSNTLDTVYSPTTEEVVGQVQNGNEADALRALQALKQHSNLGGLLLQDSVLNCYSSLLKKLKQMLIIWQSF